MTIRVTIEQLDEGFLITEDSTGKKYAVPESLLRAKLKACFGLTRKTVEPKVEPEIKPKPEPKPKPKIKEIETEPCEIKQEPTSEKVLGLALEQIDITGHYNQTRIAKELGVTSATVSYHIRNHEARLNEAMQKWQDERDKPMLKTVTRPDPDDKILDDDGTIITLLR